MFLVHQIDKTGEEKIIGCIGSENDFERAITDYLEYINITCEIVTSMTANLINSNSKYIEGYYLIFIDNKCILYQKTKKISLGYIYNSVYYETSMIYTWKLLSYEYSIKPKPHYLDDIMEFDFSKMKPNPAILVCAKRGSGKSFAIRDFMIRLKEKSNQEDFYENSLIIAPTERMNKFYGYFCPNSKILYQYDSEAIKEHLERGKGCLVLDDCISRSKCGTIDFCIKDYNIPIIITTQTPHTLKKDFAHEIDYFYFLKEDSTFFKKMIWNHFRYVIPSWHNFEITFKHLTKDYRGIIINNITTNDNVVSKIFYYKAKSVTDGKLLYNDTSDQLVIDDIYVNPVESENLLLTINDAEDNNIDENFNQSLDISIDGSIELSIESLIEMDKPYELTQCGILEIPSVDNLIIPQ
ncbi:A32-like packaging ATPase [Tupanvirus deep ocean]|uniref:A32-like packaging ATPase n=2 Tax=Tupanvirus TaxID=2094720 RepID=A0AC62AAG7_9VIRU|nr:A32-like packaging ATPase [Tupanvirus deep ocean]QKU34613.1 A32-like packaging ATPase [Tupanvirus deep ocean]